MIDCSSLDYVAIIPTMGLPHLREMIHTAAENAEGNGLFLLSLNPQADEAEDAHFRVSEIIEEFDKRNPSEKVSIKSLNYDRPLGFGGAVNNAVNWILENGGLPNHLFVLNDDLLLTRGWRLGMSQALESTEVKTMGRVAAGYTDPVDIKELSPKTKGIGMVGACSNLVAGNQKVECKEAIQKQGYREFARNYKLSNCGDVYFTDFLSGLCIGLTREAVDAVLMGSEKRNCLFEVFTCGGYEDNDLSYRLQNAGYMLGIASDVFVYHHGSQTLDKLYQDSVKGLINRGIYYSKWTKETQRDQRVIGAYRVSIKTINDLIQLKQSIIRAGKFLDGFAVLLTNDPSEALASYDAVLFNKLHETDTIVFSKNQKDKASIFQHWIKESLLSAAGISDPDYDRWKQLVSNSIVVESWAGEFNERDERNRTHEMAEDLGADFIMSIDADEVIEDRISRRIFQRQLKHPDPLVRYFHTGWLNHWESPNLVRTDAPFSNGLDSGMIGCRLWKVNKAAPYRIVAGSDVGLHCGNAPPHGKITSRVSAIRFRHLSYLRAIDRASKFQFYQNIDKEKNPAMLGGSDYSHLVSQENVEVSVYNPSNGIGSYFLAYEKESPVGIGMWLDNFYSVSDRCLMVWTGEFKNKDKKWKSLSLDEILSMGEDQFNLKFKTGPRYEVAILTKLFKCEVLEKRFVEDEGLSECRNFALDYFQNIEPSGDEVLPCGGIGWAIFADPDEMTLDDYAWQASIRRCAEVNDSWGFVTTFRNQLAGGDWSTSESIRLSRLHPIMRMNGKIHEGFDGVLREISQRSNPNIKQFPVEVFNTGLAKSPEMMRIKLERYTRMLIQELESDPFDAASWTALGLQFVNESIYDKAKTCFERAMMSGKNSFMPYREMATVQAQELLASLLGCLRRMRKTHEFAERGAKVAKIIQAYLPAHPRVETYGSVCQDVTLPAFPYDRVSINENGDFYIEPEESENGEKSGLDNVAI